MMQVPAIFIKENKIIWPYAYDNVLIVEEGQTVNMTTSLLEYDHIEVRPTGTLNITSPNGLLILAARKKLIVDGIIKARTAASSVASSNTLFNETLNFAPTQALGGGGGNGARVGGAAGIGGTGAGGYGGGGGGGALTTAGAGGSNGGGGEFAYYSTNGTPQPGGVGMSTLSHGANARDLTSNQMWLNDAVGGVGLCAGAAGGGSGGGAGKTSTNARGTGGGGGGMKGRHGSSLVIYTSGAVTGLGTIDCGGDNGFNGGRGGDFNFAWWGDSAGGGGGGGGGAGGSGGRLLVRGSSIADTLTLNFAGGAGGLGGRGGQDNNGTGRQVWPTGWGGTNGSTGAMGMMEFKNIRELF